MRVLFRCLVLLAALWCAPDAHAQKAFVREDLGSEAARLEQQVRREAQPPGLRRMDELRRDGLLALQRNNASAAMGAFASAIALEPRNGLLWIDYARAARAGAAADQRQAWRLNSVAAAAAYIGYQRASNRADEALALAIVGAAASGQGSTRAALNAWRASLDLQDDPAVRSAYERMREQFGFRILDYRVESDLAAPRACFQFSEPLPRGRDFTGFVAVSGAARPALAVEERQICVEGLRHGERYAIVLRQGLPSTVGEQLLRSADYEIYVRDRSPAVRFTGRNYVLPRVGHEGVPVVSVNTPKVAVDILRIGDRSLLPAIRSEDFLSQLSGFSARRIAAERGVKLWSGVLDVGMETNREVVTSFPVVEAVGRMEPGLYIMVARPGDTPFSRLAEGDEGSFDTQATQWLVVSDIGLTALSGEDGVHVFARSLASAEPVADVEVRLIARNNEVLATRRTDAHGRARFEAGLARGTAGLAPGAAVAVKGDDYGFLDLAQAPFDLSDRGVKGRPAPRALDAFVVAERGVYRPGERAYLTIMARDPRGGVVENMPLTLVVRRPDGVEYRRAQVEDQGLGGRSYALPLLSDARTGMWRALVYADPNSPAIGETSFLVEDYLPERLDVVVSPPRAIAVPGQPFAAPVQARYLYGAPGAGLEVSGEVVIEAAKGGGVPGLPGFAAGLEDESFESARAEIEQKTTTDAQGRATLLAPIPSLLAPRPLEARVIVRVGEPGGRAVERVVTAPVRAASAFLAVRRNFERVSEGSVATFDVAALAPDGARVQARNLRWSLYRVRNDHQWYNAGGRWAFERVKSSQKIADGVVDADPKQFARIAGKVEWGAHRLEIVSADGAFSPVSVTFTVGWSGESSADAPDVLDMSLDRQTYASGETIRARIASRFAGKITLAVVGDRVHEARLVDLRAGDNAFELPVRPEWGPGAYVVAFAHRPLDAQARRMPGRALGVAWFGVDQAQRRLAVTLDAPERIEPRRRLDVPVRLAGLAPGEAAFVAVSVVDVGILNLTRHEPPNPSAHFFGQRQLASEVRDLYGLLIDGLQGARGAIRSGGDGGAGALVGERPTQEPLALFSGVVRAGADGVATVSFDIPAFNGSVRLSAVAWSSGRVGEASKDVIVRDQVVAQATVPRFLSMGDRSRLHVRLDNVDGPAGPYVAEFDVRGPAAIALDATRVAFPLERNGRRDLTIPITAGGVGQAVVSMRLTGPGFASDQTFVLDVKPGAGEVHRRISRRLAPGESLRVSSDLVRDFLPGTGAVSVSVSTWADLDAPALLQSLDRYPYGCTEQTVSRAMPLLYVNRLASQQMLALDDSVAQRVQESIARVLARQDSSGAFGLWSANAAGADLWLDAFAADFLTRARESGYAVPQRPFDQALDRLRNQVANAGEFSPEQGRAVAYAIYVLARNGRPVMGDLRYFADARMGLFDTALARGQIAAALAQLGDRGRARKVFAEAGTQLRTAKQEPHARADYGSRLRDGAGLLALAAENGADADLVQLAGAVVRNERGASGPLSTQEMTWLVMAAQALAKDGEAATVSVDGVSHAGALHQTWRAADLDARSSVIVNTGSAPVNMLVTTKGNPAQIEPPLEQGYRVERALYTLDGRRIEAGALRQNQRVVVALTVAEADAAFARLLLVDRLPAGLEIDNPRLFEGGGAAGLTFLANRVEPAHAEFRDDRFVAAFDRDGGEKAVFTVAYIARAVTPGRYTHPPAVVEDMYRPQRFGRTGAGEFIVEAAAP